jgi:hypothetical protein
MVLTASSNTAVSRILQTPELNTMESMGGEQLEQLKQLEGNRREKRQMKERST